MRPSRVVTSLVSVLFLAGCGATSAGGSSSTAPSSGSTDPTTSSDTSPSPEDVPAGELGVELTGGRGVVLLGERWYVHGGNFEFTVTTTGSADLTAAEPLNLVLSFPTEAMRVEEAAGDGWDCADVDAGVSCTASAAPARGEPWPVLTVRATAVGYSQGESLTVEAGGPGKGSATVPLKLDTGT